MALDNNGKLSFSQIQTEFGDQDDQPAISLGEYYRDGLNVPTTRAGSKTVTNWPLLDLLRDPVQNYLEQAGSLVWPLYIQQGIVRVRMYWRTIDFTNGLCTEYQVGRQFRDDYPVAAWWFWEGILVERRYDNNTNYGNPKTVTSNDGSRTTLYQSNNFFGAENRRDDNANPIQPPFSNTGSGGQPWNPFGGSYYADYRRYQVRERIQVPTSTDINTKIPITNNPIKFPDNYYGGTNT
jgi:hypothetical protein